ncbi:MAG: FG-GAP repeat protein [Alphaproteobacteria bacterium]|nr:FG-GAP repeat protein [Alphaproteobacteria bacterium]
MTTRSDIDAPLFRGGRRDGTSRALRRGATVAGSLVVALALPLSGCQTPCEGPGCLSAYGAALVTVHDGAGLPVPGQRDPLQSYATLTGTSEQGPDRSLALLPGLLLVGIPGSDAVAALTLDGGGTLSIDQDVGGVIGETAGDRFGDALAIAPDVDGDGVPDLVVGAPTRPVDETGLDEGALYVFSGDRVRQDRRLDAAAALSRVAGSRAGGRLGAPVAGCGDVDGDGLTDVLSAAPRATADDGTALAGQVVLVSAAELALGEALGVDDLDHQWFGSDLGERAGSSLSCGADLDRDGLADLVVGAPFADGAGEARGRVYVVHGATTLPTGGDQRRLADAATLTLDGTEDEAWLGWSVATPDLDGDGRAELAAGAPGVDAQTGRVLVWQNDARLGLSTTASHRIRGARAGDAFGRNLAIGDVTGDGRADLLVGAPRFNPTESQTLDAYESGVVYVFAGPDDFADWDGLLYVSDAEVSFVRAQAYLRTGRGLAVGDFDGDDVADVALLHRIDPGG